MSIKPATEITLRIPAIVETRSLTFPRRKCYDAKLGDLEVTADDRPTATRLLAMQLQALALCPSPMYRRHKDGRGVVARVSGCGADGTLSATIDMFHPDGRFAGGYGFDLAAREHQPHRVTLESTTHEIETALRRELEHYLEGIGGV